MKIILLFLCLLYNLLYGQSYTGVLSEGKYSNIGYIIVSPIDIYFQPCRDSNISVFDALDDNAFQLDNFTLLGTELISMNSKIGDRFFFSYLRNNYNEGTATNDSIYYFYAKIDLDVFYHDNDSIPKKGITYHYEMISGEILYKFGGAFIHNSVQDIYPYKKNIQNAYIKYLQLKRFMLPKWVEER